MALDINHKESDRQLVVWKLEESTSYFLDKTDLTQEELALFESIKFDGRKREFLCARMLLQMFHPTNANLAYHSDGRPYIPNSEKHISISHSKTHLGILLTDKLGPGLDVENITGRVSKIYSKFVGVAEEIFVEKENLKAVTLLWSAKEAMFKALCMQGVDFRKHLRIENFELKERGELGGHYQSEDKQLAIRLQYQFFSDCVAVWGCRG